MAFPAPGVVSSRTVSDPTSAASPLDPAADVRHTLLDDAQAIVTAAAFVSLGLAFLKQGHLVAGGTAGMALLLSRVTPLTFGQLFLGLNLPFFWLALRRMGGRFTVKTFVAIGLTSAATDHLGAALRLEAVHPVYGALMGGFLTGVGLLILFRHQASLGGLNVLALHLQERHGIRAGLFQLGVDALILLASALIAPLHAVALSIAGAVAMNAILAVNHRPGRYVGA
jgi:uncharacterized membrane-anchored protein YitT (DUF2179 family)